MTSNALYNFAKELLGDDADPRRIEWAAKRIDAYAAEIVDNMNAAHMRQMTELARLGGNESRDDR